MTKQKKGLLLFLCSLVPGAGEMYMGFFKQGISIMLIFWGTFGLATLSSLSFIVIYWKCRPFCKKIPQTDCCFPDHLRCFYFMG